MTNELDQAVARVCEVVLFENWLRFYFIEESDDAKLFIRLPEQAMERISKRYPGFYSMVEQLNNREINHRTSLDAVCLHVAHELDGKVFRAGLGEQVFDSPAFHLEIQLFSTWVQSHEEQLDSTFLEFSLWQQQYLAWKETDQVKEYIRTLTERAEAAASDPVKMVQ